MSRVTVRVAANRYVDDGDCLDAAAAEYADEHELSEWQIDAEWADDQRDEIVLTVPGADADGDCPRCGSPANGSSGVGSCSHSCHDPDAESREPDDTDACLQEEAAERAADMRRMAGDE